MRFLMTRILLAATISLYPGSSKLFAPRPAGPSASGLVPLTELGSRAYLDRFPGGLYGLGSNQIPPAHLEAGLARAAAIGPLDAAGRPDPEGRVVLLSVGMSNTTQEFWAANQRGPTASWSFAGQAAVHPLLNRSTLAIVDGAMGGQAGPAWISPSSQNYNRVRDEQLAPLGLTEAQVQAIWLKQANIQPTASLPDSNADAYALERALADTVRACKIRYPNLKIVFLSSRIYAGYATSKLNPEPYAYESAFSVQGLIAAQADQMDRGAIDPVAGDLDYDRGAAPWLVWGPYLWADGTTPRQDGLTWLQVDFEGDGTHPSKSGEQKVGTMLLDFLLQSPFSRTWFRDYVPGDIDADGMVSNSDLWILFGSWMKPAGHPSYDLRADLDGDNRVDARDFRILTAHWGEGRVSRGTSRNP